MLFRSVLAYENMGNEQLVYFSLTGQTIIARCQPLAQMSVGINYGIRFVTDKIIFINDENGDVINIA